MICETDKARSSRDKQQKEQVARLAVAAHLRLEQVDVDSGEARMTSPSLPSRSRWPAIAIWRKVSTVSRLPIECAMMSMRLAPAFQQPERRLQTVARRHRAVTVVDIVDRAAARRPGEQHRRPGKAGIVHDLRHPVDRIVEQIVVAVHEHQHAMIVAGDVGAQRLFERGLSVE